MSFENKKICILVFSYFTFLICAVCTNVMPRAIGRSIPIILIFELYFIITLYYGLFSKKINGQAIIIMMLVVAFFDCALLSKVTNKQNRYMIIEGLLVFNISFTCMLIKYVRGKLPFLMDIQHQFIKHVKEKMYVYVILVIFILLSFDIFDTWLMGDAFRYYYGLLGSRDWNFVDFNKLKFAGHNAQGYLFFVMLGEFLMPNRVIASRIVNLIIGIVTIYCLDEIISHLFSRLTTFHRALYLAMFAFSPILFSMMAEINTDFAVLCFLIWMLDAYLHKRYLLQAFCGILLCFSKEPALLIYGMFMIGMLINCILTLEKKGFMNILKEIFSIPYLLNCVGGVMWFSYFVFCGADKIGWSDSFETNGVIKENLDLVNSFAWNKEYALFKLKQLLFMNFTWMFILVIIAFGIIILKNQTERTIMKKVNINFAIVLAGVACVIYNVIYITWTNYRYQIPIVFFVILLMQYIIYIFDKTTKFKRNLCLFLITVIFISNYITDPFAIQLFIDFKTDDCSKMVSTPLFEEEDGYVVYKDKEELSKEAWCDTMVYNKQYSYWGKTMEQFMKDVEYDENTLIIIPMALKNEMETYSRLTGSVWISFEFVRWNSETKHLEYALFQGVDKQDEGEKLKPFNIMALDTNKSITLNDYEAYDSIYYLELPFAENGKLLNNLKIDSQKTYRYLFCKINSIKLK